MSSTTAKSDSVALITGASSGMGKDIALRLISKGYAVYGAARRIERMKDIEAAGGTALSVDVADAASVVAAIDRIIAERGRIDVLINNAGYGQFGALEDVPIEVGRRQMEVNLIGAAHVTQLVLPHMRARKFGKIINISSTGGKVASPLGGWYHASKFALEGYSDSLRNEVRPFGVDVIVIEPGGIETEWGGIAEDEAERYSGKGPYADLVVKMRRAMSGLGKMPSPRVVSDLIVRALETKRPRTRYHAGRLAGPILFMRRWLSDRAMDRLIMLALR
ncbi:oxidoreductase [Bradyrhizobium sp. WSM2793]|uniref:oxidoreductase n=1 Tax=Bradyrhizobium sp. WSM2793 TaxID=1038866 RepID=UPI0003718852|nr:oxidoreductase [Bradyrhizobium sp. WSM2793]